MAVKRIESDFNLYLLPPVRLFLDDLQAILNQLAGYTDIELRHANYAYDNLEELTAHVRRHVITSLQISAWANSSLGSHVRIKFERNRVWVSGGPDSAEKVAAITHNLRSKVPWYSWTAVRGTIGFALGGAVGITLAELIAAPSGLRELLAGIPWAVLFFMSLVGRPWVGGTRIRLYAAGSQPGFWERNRDRILADALISLVSVLLGFLLARLTQ